MATRCKGGDPSALAAGLHTHDLHVDPKGDLEADELQWDTFWRVWRGGIVQVSPAGRRTETFPAALNTFPPALSFAAIGLLADDHGNRYGFTGLVPGPRRQALHRISPSGVTTLVAGGGSDQADGRGEAAGFAAVRGVRWAGAGVLYAVDGAALRKITLDGQVTTLGRAYPENPDGPPVHLLGIDLELPVVVAADYGGGRLLAFERTGAVTTLYRSDSLWSPTGVVRAGDALYILEYRRAGFSRRLLAPFGPHLRVQRLRGKEAQTVASIWSAEARTSWLLLVISALSALGLLATWRSWPTPRPSPKVVDPWLNSKSRWKQIQSHVFSLTSWVTLSLALVLFVREIFQPKGDASRLGIAGIFLLIAAFGAQFGPSLLDRIKKIGPVEMIESSPTLVKALYAIDLTDVSTYPFSGEGPSTRRLSSEQDLAYKQMDLVLSMVRYNGLEPKSPDERERYFLMLMRVGQTALILGDAQRAIFHLKFLRKVSAGNFEVSKVAFSLGFAYLTVASARENARENWGFAVQEFLEVVKRMPDLYQAYFWLAYAHDELGNYSSAVKYGRKALEITSAAGRAKYNLAISLWHDLRFEEAWKALESIRPGDLGFDEIASLARDDSDLLPFLEGDRNRFEDLPLAHANPPPW